MDDERLGLVRWFRRMWGGSDEPYRIMSNASKIGDVTCCAARAAKLQCDLHIALRTSTLSLALVASPRIEYLAMSDTTFGTGLNLFLGVKKLKRVKKS